MLKKILISFSITQHLCLAQYPSCLLDMYNNMVYDPNEFNVNLIPGEGLQIKKAQYNGKWQYVVFKNSDNNNRIFNYQFKGISDLSAPSQPYRTPGYIGYMAIGWYPESEFIADNNEIPSQCKSTGPRPGIGFYDTCPDKSWMLLNHQGSRNGGQFLIDWDDGNTDVINSNAYYIPYSGRLYTWHDMRGASSPEEVYSLYRGVWLKCRLY